jgi:hypothetical protein
MMAKMPFYSHHAQELEGSTGEKIRRLVEEQRIEYSSEDKCFYIHPIEGYNTRTYTVKADKEFGHRCNCQGFVTRERKFREAPETQKPPGCSHVAAVYEYFSRMHRARRDEKVKQAVLTMFG